jgi:hypothetical protein
MRRRTLFNLKPIDCRFDVSGVCVVVSYTHSHCRPTTTLCAVLDATGAELTHVLAQTYG